MDSAPTTDRPATRPSRWRNALGILAIGALLLLAMPFALHAARTGIAGLAGALDGASRFHAAGAWLTNPAIFGHMLAGAAVTLLAPLQLVPAIRARAPSVHRWSGRALVAGALVAGAGGLAFIALRGTIGGWPMDLGFALYGLLLMLAAVQTYRHARAGDRERHRAWALRLFVLAIGSWIYRVHYTLWYLVFGDLGRAPDFSGPFDLTQNVAFYLPYLVLLELWLRRRRV